MLSIIAHGSINFLVDLLVCVGEINQAFLGSAALIEAITYISSMNGNFFKKRVVFYGESKADRQVILANLGEEAADKSLILLQGI